MKISDAINLLQALRTIQGEKVSRTFAFAVARNIQLLTPLFETYDAQRIEIVRQYADKDENGEPVVKEGMVTISDAANQVKVNEEMNALLNRDDESITIHRVVENEFPDTLSTEMVMMLMPMLKE